MASQDYWAEAPMQRRQTTLFSPTLDDMIAADDPNVRSIHWWERLLFWHRFPLRTPGTSIMEESRR